MNPSTREEIAGETSGSGVVDETSRRPFDHMMKHEQAITIPKTNIDGPLPYLFGNREDYFHLVVPLYEASVTGNWEAAKFIFSKRPDLVRYGLCKNLGTALHVAVATKETKQSLHFVKNLVNMMTKEELEIKNMHSNTAFWIASAEGNMNMVMFMMEKNSRLVDIRCQSYLPLSIAAMEGTRRIVKWLYHHSQKMTAHHWTDSERDFTLRTCVERGFFDIALQILEDHPELARKNVSPLLGALARKPNYVIDIVETKRQIVESTCRFFGIQVGEDHNELILLNIIWEEATKSMDIDGILGMLRVSSNFFLSGGSAPTINNMLEGVKDMLSDTTAGVVNRKEKPAAASRMLFIAAEAGNTRFIAAVLRSYPDVMLDINEDGLSIFHIAVMHRHQGIFNLLYEIGRGYSHDICLCSDKSNNNMLHLVGKTSKEMGSKTSGASLLLQRELLWFIAVEKMMPPFMREAKNKDGQTPYELFSKENEDQVNKGLKWMKDCMVVATLIVTLAFAAAITVPGDYDDVDGLPIHIHSHAFLVFAIANAISLFSSSTSLLVFLCILTSRQEEQDFYRSLPSKLMAGLLTLLVSVAAMMVTFSASFYVLYKHDFIWIPILVGAFTAVPVIVFAVLQTPVLVDMFRSMYDSHYLFKTNKRVLYPPKTKTTTKLNHN